jgi:hypothetical protein
MFLKKIDKMKKVYFPLMIVAALSLASCHKARTCTCTVTSTSSFGSGSSTSTSVDTWERATKHEAGSRCMSRTEVTTVTGGSFTDTYDCKLN